MSINKSLEDGFTLAFPPSAMIPHPFVMHDVTQHDWTLFIQQIKAVAGLSITDRVIANVVPLALNANLIPSLLMTGGIEIGMKAKKVTSIAELIEQWNLYFFGPRRISIELWRGRICCTDSSTASSETQELPNNQSMQSFENLDPMASGKQERRREKKALERVKRLRKNAIKQEQKETKRAEKEARSEQWTLVISHHISARW
ncbi:hypothetical protein CERSUDRAFT_116828 [Gelatoporia subvermispora B]|uniref:Uncharacterized protein n=1 Tax=Ceriporiopsis subvermispora (strain B) TaxID=914234 RepID=M2R7I6_CERS8|nr:hypothetical protein CERSUDRAFT_116828 [Gelatoporia subvermispora B]